MPKRTTAQPNTCCKHDQRMVGCVCRQRRGLNGASSLRYLKGLLGLSTCVCVQHVSLIRQVSLKGRVGALAQRWRYDVAFCATKTCNSTCRDALHVCHLFEVAQLLIIVHPALPLVFILRQVQGDFAPCNSLLCKERCRQGSQSSDAQARDNCNDRFKRRSEGKSLKSSWRKGG